MPRRWPKGKIFVCELCGQRPVAYVSGWCDECWDWMGKYRNEDFRGRRRLTIRQIYSLRQRAALELPLFEGGKLCV
jgi:hypothetical protein